MKNIFIKITVLALLISLMVGQAIYAVPPKTLTDIKGNWAEADILALHSKGIITGNGNGKYEPNKSITRSEFTALIVRAMGLQLKKDGSSFADVNYSKYWAKPYIETAVAKGIIIPTEIGENFFGDVPLKRLDMAVMMARALGLQPSDSQANPYIDMQEPNGYVTKLYEDYLMRGYAESGKLLFKQNSQTNKAEAATVVSRILQYKTNPQKYVADCEMAERFKLGEPTKEDIEKKIVEEVKKQEQSKSYIMEPIITLEYNEEPYYGWYFNLILENQRDYANGCYVKVECLTIPELNEFEQPTPNGKYIKHSYNIYEPIGSVAYGTLLYTLRSTYYTTRTNMNKVDIKPGMELEYKITIKRGTDTKSVIKMVKVPLFTQ